MGAGEMDSWIRAHGLCIHGFFCMICVHDMEFVYMIHVKYYVEVEVGMAREGIFIYKYESCAVKLPTPLPPPPQQDKVSVCALNYILNLKSSPCQQTRQAETHHKPPTTQNPP